MTAGAETQLDAEVIELASELTAACASGQRSVIGQRYQEVLDSGLDEQIANLLTTSLRERLAQRIGEVEEVGQVIERVHSVVLPRLAAVNEVLEVDLVSLEHVGRSALGLSAYLYEVGAAFAVLASALLNAVLDLPAVPPAQCRTASSDTGTCAVEPAARQAVDSAIEALTLGDIAGWRARVAGLLDALPARGEPAPLAALRERLHRGGIQAGMIAAVAHGSAVLSAAAADGPLACPAVLIESVIRRSLGEPCCGLDLDSMQLIYLCTQVAAMLDVHDTLLPPGWGWVVHGSLD